MRPLDNNSILALRKVLEPANKSLPYALILGEHVIVTNHATLLEWPLELVDQTCPRFNKLLDNQQQKEYASARDRIKEQGWRSLLFDPDGKFLKVTEVEPNDDDLATEDDQIIYQYRSHRIEYGAYNFDAVELFIENPYYMLYKAPKGTTPSESKPLVVFEQGVSEPVGVFMNDFPRSGRPRTARSPEDR